MLEFFVSCDEFTSDRMDDWCTEVGALLRIGCAGVAVRRSCCITVRDIDLRCQGSDGMHRKSTAWASRAMTLLA